MTNLTRAAAIVDEATRELARSNDEADRPDASSLA